MKRLCVVAIGMALFAFSLGNGSAAPPEPPCVPHWVVVQSASGYACHQEGFWWVATGTTWRYLKDDMCNRPSRWECNEWHHRDWLYPSYNECCADTGGCPVPACNM